MHTPTSFTTSSSLGKTGSPRPSSSGGGPKSTTTATSSSTGNMKTAFSSKVPTNLTPSKFLQIAKQLVEQLQTIHEDERKQMHGHIYRVEKVRKSSKSASSTQLQSVDSTLGSSKTNLASTSEELAVSSPRTFNDETSSSSRAGDDQNSSSGGSLSATSTSPIEYKLIYEPGRSTPPITHISPEQTGRMNRSTDFRTDFYSLGIVFYAMLNNGRLPFESNGADALDIMYAHIVKKPDAIEACPPILNDLVQKCLAKMPQDRYQSCHGLYEDLLQCERLVAEGKIMDGTFTLGEHDFSGKLSLSQKLYGRDEEVQAIIRELTTPSDTDRTDDELTGVSTAGPVVRSTFVSISGHSGVGKSSLIKEVQKEMSNQRCFMVSGKHDQYNRTIPYSAIKSSLNDLIQEILMESDDMIDQWKDTILAALGANAACMTAFLPSLQVLIGTPAPVIPLEGKAAQDRFTQVMVRFLDAISSPQRPLIVFVDDMQWCDSATLDLLTVLLVKNQIEGFLLAGAYRDNEVDEHHGFYLLLQELRKNQLCSLLEFHIEPLKSEHVYEMVSDVTACTSCEDLSKVLYEKTGGNPFFLQQILKRVHEDKNLWFDRSARIWQWNLEEIQEMEASVNVISILIDKIQTLSSSAQKILKLASVVGHNFSIRNIMDAMELDNSKNQVNEAVNETVLAELIAPIRRGSLFMQRDDDVDPEAHAGSYRFVHDRVQQSAYTLLSEDEKVHHHMRYGIYLYIKEKDSDQSLRKHIFDIVDHLNHASDLLREHQTVNHHILSRLNRIAAEKAFEAVAYESAHEYVSRALSIYPGDIWQQDEDYAYETSLLELRCEFVEGTPTSAAKKGEELLSRVKQVLRRCEVYRLQMTSLLRLGHNFKVAQLGCKACDELGYKMSPEPSPAIMMGKLLQAFAKLRKYPPQNFAKMPTMTDEKACIYTNILLTISSAAVNMGNDALMIVSTVNSVLLPFKYGVSPQTNFTLLSLILVGLGKFQLAQEYCDVGLAVGERFCHPASIGIACFVSSGFTRHWSSPFAESTPEYHRANQLLLQSGDLLYWTYNEAVWKAINVELSNIDERLAALNKGKNYFIDVAKQDEQSLQVYDLFTAFYHALKGETEGGITSLKHPSFDEEGFIKWKEENKSASLHFYHNFARTLLCVLNSEYKKAQTYGKKAAKYLAAVNGLRTTMFFYLFHALSQTLAPGSTDMKVVKKYLNILRKGAIGCFRNWGPMYLLVLAEKARVTNSAVPLPKKIRVALAEVLPEHSVLTMRKISCEHLYDVAIDVAAIDEYPICLAICNEVAARHYLRRNNVRSALLFLKEAHHQWIRYGATQKAQLLMEEFPQMSDCMFSHQLVEKEAKQQNAVDGEPNVESVDVLTIAKASQALSQEVKLQNVLETLLKLSIQNAGAESGLLMLWNKQTESFNVVSHGSNANGQVNIKVVKHVPLLEYSDISLKLCNLCRRQQQELIVANATEDARLQGESLNGEEKSLFLLPISRMGDCLGMVYLRNRTYTGAFTSQHKQTLSIIAAQAGISLENAELYENLEGLVQQRTEELNKLLHNVYPVKILERMRKGEIKIADSIDNASLFFSDLVKFTNFTNRNAVYVVHEMLDWIFGRMDDLALQCDVNKIKTIGDAFVAISGAPDADEDHAYKMAEFALGSLEIMDQYNEYVKRENESIELHNSQCDENHVTAEERGYTEEELKTMEFLSAEEAEYYVHKYNRMHEIYNREIDAFNKGRTEKKKRRRLDMIQCRIGLHCGPLIAGVFTETRPIYDVLGDTCNCASRMESHGAAGKVHISETFYESISDRYVCSYRGEMKVKGKGIMRTYFLEGRREGVEPLSPAAKEKQQ